MQLERGDDFEAKKSRVQLVFGIIFFLIVIVLLVFYWFIPINTTEFTFKEINSNFSVGNLSQQMQFYPNMRYSSPQISYKIYDCSVKKKNDMQQAFDILSNLTILDFYEVSYNEGISVYCESKNRIEDGMFIAGEGGPTNITRAGEFNVIFHGEILLIRESNCPLPNVAIHELLHVLGFEHSLNSNNIMYNFSDCKQTIGEDIPLAINHVYSFPTAPDLVFEDVTAIMHGKYLDVNLSIRNNGLADSGDSNLLFYADEKFIKEFSLGSLGVGYGTKITLSNVWISQLTVDELRILIESPLEELDETNNEVILDIKK